MSEATAAELSRGARNAPVCDGVLPAPVTTFIGRDRALASVGQLVATQRLVTLLGPAGCGKTRLAIETGRGCQPRFTDGVVWVELAPLADADLVAPIVLSACGLRHQPGQAPADALAEHLAARSVLLILDNCEHVIDEAADLVQTLLQAAPGLHVLATSRERLGVPGEQSWPVPPLGLPSRRARDMDAVLGTESVRLFMDRASSVAPVYALEADSLGAIADICIRLDGIPLAIELAAARMNVLTPRQIAARLADAMGLLTTGARTLPARQRTLRAAIDWSHALLSDCERILFRRLAVFGGTFSLDAVEAVCSDDNLPAGEVLDTLASLTDKSLVAVRERDGEARYRLLDAVRQYAAEQLHATAESGTLLARHARWYADVVGLYAPRLRSGRRFRAVAAIDADMDNIRAALDWTRATPGFLALHQEILSRLWWYWLYRVQWDEGLQRLSAGIASADDSVPPVLLAESLQGGGMLAWMNGQFLQSRVWLERCVELRRAAGDAGPLGMALCQLAQPVADLGERELARDLASEGMTLVRAGATPWDIAASATCYGYVHHVCGHMDEAERAYLEADAHWSDDNWSRSLSRNSLAVLSWRRGDVALAETRARESLEALRDLGDRWFTARTLLILGFLALQRGDARRSTRLLAASESLRREVGARLMVFEAPHWGSCIQANRTLLGDAFEEAWREGAALVFAEAVDLALEPVPAGLAVPDGPEGTAPPAGAPAPARPAATAPYSHVPVRVEAHASPQPVPAVAVHALGPLQVLRAGQLVSNDEWTYAKPRELLVYLLCHPDGRTKEQIGLDLWPDASPARLRSSFHVTMHHVRRVLGATEWLAYEHGRYRFFAMQPYHFDVAAFEERLDLARSAQPADARLRLLQSAIDLYRGDFIEDATFGGWSETRRDVLRRSYFDACLRAGRLHLDAGRQDEAEAAARRVLARDNLDERAHRLLLETLAATGRTADAARHFQVLTALFREELGVAPSAETATLAQRIISP